MSKVYHEFQVTHKVNLSMAEAFQVAQDILDDVSSTLRKEWPKRTELRLRDVTKNENGIKVYHFHVLAL